MSPILLALSPVLVSLLTQWLKKLPAFANLPESSHKAFVRVLAAVLAFLTALLGAWMSGTEVDPIAIETFVNAIVAFLGASGIYFFTHTPKPRY